MNRNSGNNNNIDLLVGLALVVVRARVVRALVDVAIHVDAWDELFNPGLVGLVGLALVGGAAGCLVNQRNGLHNNHYTPQYGNQYAWQY